jgi:anti-anti-sigma factor
VVAVRRVEQVLAPVTRRSVCVGDEQTRHVVAEFVHHPTDSFVRLAGELDLDAQTPITAALLEAYLAASRVVIDMSAVRFMDSTALNAIARLVARTRDDRHAAVVIRSASVPIRRLFRVTGLDTLVDSDP